MTFASFTKFMNTAREASGLKTTEVAKRLDCSINNLAFMFKESDTRWFRFERVAGMMNSTVLNILNVAEIINADPYEALAHLGIYPSQPMSEYKTSLLPNKKRKESIDCGVDDSRGRKDYVSIAKDEDPNEAMIRARANKLVHTSRDSIVLEIMLATETVGLDKLPAILDSFERRLGAKQKWQEAVAASRGSKEICFDI